MPYQYWGEYKPPGWSPQAPMMIPPTLSRMHAGGGMGPNPFFGMHHSPWSGFGGQHFMGSRMGMQPWMFCIACRVCCYHLQQLQCWRATDWPTGVLPERDEGTVRARQSDKASASRRHRKRLVPIAQLEFMLRWPDFSARFPPTCSTGPAITRRTRETT